MAIPKRAARSAWGFVAAFAAAVAFAANPPEVAPGVAWLGAQVQADGSVAGDGASIATAFQARAETHATLRQLSTASAALADRVAQESADNVEYASRQAIVLAPAGRDVTATINAIVGVQNADGGFGGAAGYQSNVLDTAFALLALKASGVSTSPAASAAISYLRTAQSADGSFGINEQSSIYVSAYAVLALNAFSQAYSSTTALQSAKTWLVAQQAAGAYASVLDNAVAAIALAAITTDTTAFAGAQAALKSAQLTNGSWAGDPYLTALALRALVATGTTPAPSTTGEITGLVVDNASGQPIADAAVQASGPMLASANTNATGGFTLGALTPGSYTVQIVKSGYASVTQTVTVTAGVATSLGTVRLGAASATATLQGTIRDANGQPLAGVSVAISGGPATTTDANGFYQLANLIPGTFSISASKSGYQTLNATATISAGSVLVFSPTLYLPGQGDTTASIAGRVTDAATGQGIVGATVRVGTATATTTSGGAFTLSGLPAGGVSVEVGAAGYSSKTLTGTLALGPNDVGTVALDRLATSARVTGRVFDRATNLPVGGATIAIGAASAVTNSSGNYEIAGITQTQFTVVAGAPGYQTRSVSVTLPVLADATVDVALDRVATGSLSLKSVALDKTAYPPFSSVEIAAEVQNATAAAVVARVAATVLDGQRNPIFEVAAVSATIPAASGSTPGIAEVELETHLGAQAPGNYFVVARLYDANDVLVGESSAAFVVDAVAKLTANIGIDPPLVQGGIDQPVHITSSVFNGGNQSLPAGGVEVAITLEQPDTQSVPAITATPSIIINGTPASGLSAGVYDANGALYLLNSGDRKVLKFSAAGVLEATYQLPTVNGYSFRSLAVSPGFIYAITVFGTVVELNTSTGTSRSISTGLASVNNVFDRAPNGDFYFAGVSSEPNRGGIRLFRMDKDGGNRQELVGAGINTPLGLARAADGTFYVGSYLGNFIGRIDPSGSLTNLAEGVLRARGVAIGPDGYIYVASEVLNNVTRISPAGVKDALPYASNPSGQTLISAPHDIKFDAGGNLFIVNSGNNTIVKVDTQKVVQPFARTVAAGPVGLAYDSSGNLFVASFPERSLNKLTPADVTSTVCTAGSFVNPVGVAVNGLQEVFVSVDQQVLKVGGSPCTQAAAVSLKNARGIAFDAANKLYIAEKDIDRISRVDTGTAAVAHVTSFITAPADVKVAANGDRYVLNDKFISKIPASGAATALPRWSGFAGSSFGLDSAGNFYVVTDNTAVRKFDASGASVWPSPASTPFLARGVVVAANGDVFVADSSSNIRRISPAGALDPVVYVAAGGSATHLISDNAGGFFLLQSSGIVKAISASKAVTNFVTLPAGTSARSIALDPAGNKLYVVTTQGVISYNTQNPTQAPASFVSGKPNYWYADFGAGAFQVVDTNTRELVSYSSLGAPLGSIAGFYQPAGIAWNGSQLLIADTQRLLAVDPGGYPRIISETKLGESLIVTGGFVYGTNGGNVMRVPLDPALPNPRAALVHYAVPGTNTLGGLALRASDGAIAVSSTPDNRVEVITSASPATQIASYAGMNGADALAIDAAGYVYVSKTATSGQGIIRIQPDGKRAVVFAPATGAGALTLDAAGYLYAAEAAGAVYRYDTTTGAKTLFARSSDTSATDMLSGLVVVGTDLYALDSKLQLLRKKAPNGDLMEPYAFGLINPTAVRVAADGNVYVANSSETGNVVRYSTTQNRLEPVASGYVNLNDIAVTSSGRIYTSSASGEISVRGVDGVRAMLPQLQGQGAPAGVAFALAAGPGETVAAFASSFAMKNSYAFAPTYPPAGTVVKTLSSTMTAVAVGGGSAAVDFGSWLPPYPGEYRLDFRSTAGIPGSATNHLHVGPGSTALMTTAAPRAPPGDSTVRVNIAVTGADFTSVARIDTGAIPQPLDTVARADAMGADRDGNIYYTVPVPFATQVRQITPSGVDSPIKDTQSGPWLKGQLPVDNAGKLYVVTGFDGKTIQTLDPANGNALAPYATVSDRVRSLAIDSSDRLVVLTDTGVFRIARDTAKTRLPIDSWPASASPFVMTIDGKDNVYVHFGSSSAAGDLVRYSANGTKATLLYKGSYPLFEYEGSSIAGDCADNLFLTPISWPAYGQSTEEYTLVQWNGRDNRLAQILDGHTVSSDFTDMDGMAYDRFSQSLLIWAHTGPTGKIFRIPLKCGTTTSDVHVVVPAGQPVLSSSIAPNSVTPRPDGSREYVWNVNDVSLKGSVVTLDTTLAGLHAGDVRSVASEAFLTFRSAFTTGVITVPVAVPSVTVDGMVDVAASTDRTSYPANTNVVSHVVLTNRDTAAVRGGNLQVEVTDAQGALVGVIAQQSASVAASGTLDVQPAFNTGTLLVGSYKLNATLSDASNGALISAATAGFDIVADGTRLLSSVSTDKQSYQPLDTVIIDARAKNVSLNSIASGLGITVVVRDPSGTAIFVPDQRLLSTLVPGALQDSFFTLRLNAAAAGEYTVTVTLTENGAAADVPRTTKFTVLSTVDTGSGLSGSVTATALANRRDSVTIAADLANSGNAALVGLPITFKVVDPRNNQLYGPWTQAVTIAQGERRTVSQDWLADVPAGTYIAAASATFNGREIALGQANVRVGEIQPFAFAPRTNVPLDTAIESDTVTIAGIVVPAPIKVEGGEFRINDGGWTALDGLTVAAGDRVAVRVNSAHTFNAKTSVKLTVAGFVAQFEVTTVNPDTTPDPFSFPAQTDVPLNSVRTTDPVIITGIDSATPLVIGAGGTFSINGAPFTAGIGTVYNGDRVAVRVTSAATLGTTTSVLVVIGGVQATFSVTTTALDTTPEPFAFTPQNGVPRSTLVTSNSVNITGINTSVPISVVDGEYRIGDTGTFTAVSGTVSNGDKVTVRQTSSSLFEKTTTTKLTVSNFTANFAVTTEGEDRTPDAFVFNPQSDVPVSSMRTSNTVTITGINVKVPVQVAGGEYSVNGAPYLSTQGEVGANDTVTVRQLSSSSFATTTTATLTVSQFAAPFAVTTKASADVTTLPTFNAGSRVLVLMSCKTAADESIEDPPCTEQRRTFLDGYLTSLEVSHTIVTTAEAFRVEMRSGRYNTYWVSGGAAKLFDPLVVELREAAFRGEAVIVDGAHDERNKPLDDAVGMIFKGKPTGLTSVTLGSPLLPPGTFDVGGSRPLRVELDSSAIRQAVFNTGDPAIAVNSYGFGTGLLFAFDLTGTLAAQSASTLLRFMVLDTLAEAAPDVPATFTGGAYVPLSIKVKNVEPVTVTLDVVATLPTGFALAAGAPPAVVTGSQVTWHVTLAPGATQVLDFAVRTADASGSYTIPVAVTQVYGTTSVAIGTYPIAIVVRGADTQVAPVIAAVQALALSSTLEQHARDAAVAKLQTAQGQLAAANFEGAIQSFADAVDQLALITSINVATQQAAIDNLLKEAERRWWSALPPCPATPACRS